MPKTIISSEIRKQIIGNTHFCKLLFDKILYDLMNTALLKCDY